MNKGERTRREILKTAERIVLERGFAGTSIESILAAAKITKGGFFYHFDGKSDLARNLMLLYLEEDEAFFRGLIEQAQHLSEDPLQQLLIFLKLMADEMAKLPSTHPGCLVASFTYESQQFDDDVKSLAAKGVLLWRTTFVAFFEAARAKHPMRLNVESSELADMLTSVIEGGIITSRTLDDPKILVQQLLQFRNYVRLLFDDV